MKVTQIDIVIGDWYKQNKTLQDAPLLKVLWWPYTISQLGYTGSGLFPELFHTVHRSVTAVTAL